MDDLHRASDPATSPGELQRIAAATPGARALVVAHPNAYPALLEWLAGLGDPAVNLALARRAAGIAGAPAAPPPPPPAPPVSAPTASAPQTASPATTSPAPPPSPKGAPARRRRRWVPLVAVGAGLAVVAAAAVVVVPRLLGGGGERSPFADGAEFAWQATATELAGETAYFGYEVSPLLIGDTIITNLYPESGGGSEEGLVVAVDAATGEQRWRVEGSGRVCQPWGPAHIGCINDTGSHPTLQRLAVADGSITLTLELTGHRAGEGIWTSVGFSEPNTPVLTPNRDQDAFTFTVFDDSGAALVDAIEGVGSFSEAQVADDGTVALSSQVGDEWRTVVYSSQGVVSLMVVGAGVRLAPNGTLFHPSDAEVDRITEAVPAIELPDEGTLWILRDDEGWSPVLMQASGRPLLLDPDTGEVVARLGDELGVFRAVIDGTPHLVMCDGDDLVVWSLEGEEVESKATCDSRPRISNGLLLERSGPDDDARLTALDPISGESVWQLDIGSFGFSDSGPGVIMVTEWGDSGEGIALGAIVPTTGS